MIVFTANGRCAKIKADEPITTGSVGMPVSVVLSGDFDGLAATMVFACGDVSADAALMGQEVTVPPQVLEEAGRVLEIGVYGARADGTIVIPTVWAKAGIVHEGVLPSGVDPAEPTPSWAAQVQQWAEDAHDTAEQLAEDVASWEAEIDTAIENARDATQDATQTAASIAQAESSRVTAEQARATAESSRAAAESARVTAEASRATAEQSRAAAETARESAESTRATAETARATAESARATAEQGRVTAEQSRATAETARASAESGRVTAEQGRASAENARASAESARVTAESARASAETSRATAETARASAESTRATEWATIKEEAEGAITAAQSATEAANDAAALATRAAASTWNAGNVLKGTLAESTVLTADDAWAAPPESVEVFGKSTQDGTPTPDAPVEIKSVDDLTLSFAGRNLLPRELYASTYYALDDGGYYVKATGFAWSYANTCSRVRLPAGTYTASAELISEETNIYAEIRVYDSSNTQLAGTYLNAGTSATFTLAEETDVGIAIKVFATNNRAELQIQAGSVATAYEPYTAPTSVQIPLSNNSVRSLPDGTRDTLTLSYQGPSTRDGWGVFGVELVQRVMETTIDGNHAIVQVPYADYLRVNLNVPTYMNSAAMADQLMWRSNGIAANSMTIGGNKTVFAWLSYSDFPTLADYKAHLAEHPMTLLYALATPITHDLGTVELPVLPAPDLTAWCDGGSAQPTLSMVYEQDINIVIGELRDAIADMATS